MWDEPEHYSQYGASYNIQPLIGNTKDHLGAKGMSLEGGIRLWVQKVGGEQRKCPAWLIYAWCETGEESAWAKKDFDQIKRQYKENWLKKWFESRYNTGEGIGSTRAVVRGSASQVDVTCILPASPKHVEMETHDADCLEILKERNINFLASLKSWCDEVLNKGIDMSNEKHEQQNMRMTSRERGRQLYDMGKHKEALSCFKNAETEGDIYAAFYLWQLYSGVGDVPKDERLSQYYLEIIKNRKQQFLDAASSGNSDAQFNLGLYFHYGVFGQEDFQKAIECFKKAAVQGHSMAQCNLGWHYQHSEEKDLGQAIKYYQLEAQQEYSKVQETLLEDRTFQNFLQSNQTTTITTDTVTTTTAATTTALTTGVVPVVFSRRSSSDMDVEEDVVPTKTEGPAFNPNPIS